MFGGDREALSAEARSGLSLFYGNRLGCGGCHSGPDLTDGLPHNIGLPPGQGPEGDHGLREKSLRIADEGRFSDAQPSQRAVDRALFARWDGAPILAEQSSLIIGRRRGASLDAALQKRSISDADVRAIIVFLAALSDEQFVKNPNFALPKTACGKPL